MALTPNPSVAPDRGPFAVLNERERTCSGRGALSRRSPHRSLPHSIGGDGYLRAGVVTYCTFPYSSYAGVE